MIFTEINISFYLKHSCSKGKLNIKRENETQAVNKKKRKKRKCSKH